MAWINLNHTNPAAPTGTVNVWFQKGSGAGSQDSPYPVSAWVQAASTTAPGVLKYDGTAGHVLWGDGSWRALALTDLPASLRPGAIGVTVDGGSATPGTGSKGFVKVPWNCVIVGWSILADQAGDAVFDIRKASSASGIGSAASIVSTHPPTLGAAQGIDSTILTGWTLTLNAGDFLEFRLSSVATLIRATLELTVQKQ